MKYFDLIFCFKIECGFALMSCLFDGRVLTTFSLLEPEFYLSSISVDRRKTFSSSSEFGNIDTCARIALGERNVNDKDESVRYDFSHDSFTGFGRWGFSTLSVYS